jgi:hypothetical protein
MGLLFFSIRVITILRLLRVDLESTATPTIPDPDRKTSRDFFEVDGAEPPIGKRLFRKPTSEIVRNGRVRTPGSRK